MTGTTGLSDTFTRTVASGWGTADTGQAYTVQGTAADFAVNGTMGIITPGAISSSRIAVVDMRAVDFNVTHQWKINALPASGIVAIGAVGRYTNSSNYYRGSVQISTAGAVLAVVDRNVGGTVTTVASASVSGLTIAGNTLYGFRFAGRYDWATQTMILYVKVWPTTAAEPYGWSLVTSELVTLAPPAASNVGAYGAVTVATGPVISYDGLATANHALPFPGAADPMCYDPTVAYPRRTAAASLGLAIDTYMSATIDPDAARAGTPAAVRVSKSNWSGTASSNLFFDTVEYNTGTPTDLTVFPTGVILGTGVWLTIAEVVVPLSSDMTDGAIFFNNSSQSFRIDNTAAPGSLGGIGGAAQVSQLVQVDGSVGPQKFNPTFLANSSSGNWLVTYIAMTAYRISDFF